MVCSVQAIPQRICEDTIQIHTNCTMITPHLSCTIYNYTIYNATPDNNIGQLIEQDNLTLINSSKYYFNFTKGEGNYIIELCDGTTRMVQVKNTGDNTVLGIIILSPLLLAFLFMFIAHSLGEGHTVLKISMMMLSMVSVFTGWQFSAIVLVDFFGQTQLTDAVATATYLYSWIFYIVLTYFIIYFIVIVIQGIVKRRDQRFQY